MKDKIVKCRKDHPCAMCEEDVKKGEKARFSEWRQGDYNEHDKQIGVQYMKIWIHADHSEETDCPDCRHRTAYIEIAPEIYKCSHCKYAEHY